MIIKGTALIKIEDGDIPLDGHFIIPQHITVISDRAFRGCTGLTTVTFNKRLIKIGHEAFRDCTQLTAVTFNEGLIQIGISAFEDCTGLKAVNFNKELTQINDGAFAGCIGLTDVTFNEYLTQVGQAAFEGCTGLTSLTFNDQLTQIGDGAFFCCTGLTVVIFNKHLKQIDDWAFAGCTQLSAITFNENLTQIGKWAFFRCTSLSAVHFNKELIGIGSKAFKGCTQLKVVIFNKNVTQIGACAFLDCTNIKDIAIETKSKQVYDRVKKLLPDGLRAQCIEMSVYEKLLTIRTEALRAILAEPVTNPIRRYAKNLSSFENLPQYTDFWRMLNQIDPGSNPLYNKVKPLMSLLPWPVTRDEQGFTTYREQCQEKVSAYLSKITLGFFACSINPDTSEQSAGLSILSTTENPCEKINMEPNL